jgi:hypothetical protein
LAAGLYHPNKKQPQISPSLLPLAIERVQLPSPPRFLVGEVARIKKHILLIGLDKKVKQKLS